MTIEDGAQGAEVEGAHEAPVSSQADEELARKLGWIPEDEFKGDRKPERFKSAREFIEDTPQSVLKLLERVEKQSEAKLAERLSKIEKVNEATIARLSKLHEQDIANLKAGRREAVKEGNVDLVEKYDEAIEKQQKEAPLTDDPKAERDKAEQAFADANLWYGPNRKMTAFARGLSGDLYNANPKLSFADNIKAVLVAVHEEFPEYFDKKQPAANGHAAVDGGSENGGSPSRNDPFAKLSQAERKKAESDMKLYPTVYPTKASWMDSFNS